METLSTVDSFEMDEGVRRVGEPVIVANRELPPITEHPQLPALGMPTVSSSQPSSSDPSPGTSVSDHTAMITEITPDSGPTPPPPPPPLLSS